MRIGILSDTHDRQERAGKAVAALVDAGAEVLIHCGDLTVPDIVYECAPRPSYFVFGNNDDDVDGIRAAIDAIQGNCLGWGGIVTIGGKRIGITHGDQRREVAKLVAESPDYFLFGHSHIPSDERRGPTRWINPGALHRADQWTVALLNLDTDGLEFLKIR